MNKMNRIVVFTVICIVGLLSFTSCGSTAPCGLSEKSSHIKNINLQQQIIVADISVEQNS